MGTVCQKCGDAGFFELLIYCIDCRVAAEHRYCLNELPESDDDEVIWSCEDCNPKVPKKASLNELSLGGQSASAVFPPSKKRYKNRYNISCTEEKAMVSSVRQPSCVYAEDAHDSAGTSDPSLSDGQKNCMSPCDEKTEEDGKIKRRRRRLILADADDSDRDSEPAGSGQKSANNVVTDQRAMQRRSSHSLNDVPDRSTEPRTCCGTPDQAPKRLQATSSGASDFQETVPVPSACNPPSNTLSHQPLDDDDSYVHARPIIDLVWRGCFNINNRVYDMVAHLSNKACSKVFDEGVKMLSPMLSVEMLPRADAWPKSFQRSAPTDDNIGLYFFPESERDEVFYQLLHEINDGDLSLKVIFDEAELLIFSSLLLPQQQSRFLGRYFMWGTFRSVSHPQKPDDCKRNTEKGISSTSEERRSPKWQRNRFSSDQPNNELELFPLEGEDMAIMARVGAKQGFDLELGLGRPVGADGKAASVGCKPRNSGTVDSSLSMDKAVTALNGMGIMLDR